MTVKYKGAVSVPKCKECKAPLFRDLEGAGRLSEHFGRMVLVCPVCKEKTSVPVERATGDK